MNEIKEKPVTSKDNEINLIETIQRVNDVRSERLKIQIEKLRATEKKWNEHIKELKHRMPMIVAASRTLGCMVEDLHFVKTGYHDETEWTHDNMLNVEFTMVPFNGKVKFYNFKGYTNSGGSKNDKKKTEQGLRMERMFKDATGLSTSVNQMCFEVDEPNERKRVLVTMWVKV